MFGFVKKIVLEVKFRKCNPFELREKPINIRAVLNIIETYSILICVGLTGTCCDDHETAVILHYRWLNLHMQ